MKETISIATKKELSKIMSFIDSQWKEGHLLSKDKDFFLYEYQNGENLNFIIAQDQKLNIVGMLGFLKSNAKENSDVWTTMWKVSERKTNPILGIEMLDYLGKQGFRTLMTSGANDETVPIYEYLGFTAGSLNQYFFINDSLDNFQIASFNKPIKKSNLSKDRDLSFGVRRVSSEELRTNFQFEHYISRVPCKDWNYFNSRFYRHPYYSYEVYGIFFKKEIISLLVTRIVNHDSASAMRIVDFYGEEDSFPYAADFLKTVMLEKGYEYIDILFFGLDSDLLDRSGFLQLDLDSADIIIPNYFDPFIRKNIKINFCVATQSIEKVKFFKADADQDRPSTAPRALRK